MNQSLAHLDGKTRGVLERAVVTLTTRYGSDLIAVVLYGSATGSEFIPRRSDLNLLILLARVNVAALETARDLAGRWRRERVVPVLMTGTDLHSSLDVFPIEMLELQTSRIVLWGQDPFAQLSVQQADLRLQCEHELKRHLFRFRRAYLGLGWGNGERSRLLIASVTGLLPLFRTLIRLIETTPQPVTSRDVLLRIADHTGIDHSSFHAVLDLKRNGRHRSASEWRALMDAYLAELERLIEAVDRLKAGSTRT